MVRVSAVRVAITPLTLAFSPFDTPNPNPTNRQHITALHTTIDFDVRIMLVVPHFHQFVRG
jgi:hypothetical protein